MLFLALQKVLDRSIAFTQKLPLVDGWPSSFRREFLRPHMLLQRHLVLTLSLIVCRLSSLGLTTNSHKMYSNMIYY
ncbi:unnamed protein product [Acanthoscelides obtectus]|uniref:Uncharacterized protein n=1 Tax=Acanthoscelides obtectus TaxID=200917 RepID=A0A9P0QDP1_ACAOB|nr:unnamed protein product [Acanthoscelides obtectus]CAK1627189.1 hypothetical protein AOBTE_LOCUS4372 [Acanthoscelides obtectus]